MRTGLTIERRHEGRPTPSAATVAALLSAVMCLVIAGCGAAGSPKAPPTATPTAIAPAKASATPYTRSPSPSLPTAAPTAAPSPDPTPTSAQVVAAGGAVFPYLRSPGGYSACNRAYAISRCPFSARLRTQIAVYAAACPQGCAGAGLISRMQCQSWTRETVSESTYLIAAVALSGGNCPTTTYYIPVVMENQRVVADDVWCGQEATAFGMYNYTAGARGGLACSFV
jgi:hypothetical protein